jgi:hypothetical protein
LLDSLRSIIQELSFMRFILALFLAVSLHAQVKPSPKVLPQASAATSVNLGLVSKCPQASPAILMWSGTGFFCANLGFGLSLSQSGMLLVTVAASPVPQWSLEVVSLASLTTGATGISYTPLHTPINGLVMYSYISASVGLTNSGAVQYTGNPLNLTLPSGWQNCTIAPIPANCIADILQIFYQYQ